VTGGWRKPYNKELHKLYSSPSILRMVKSRKTRKAGETGVHIVTGWKARRKATTRKPKT
jgi:hypothetical protein